MRRLCPQPVLQPFLLFWLVFVIMASRHAQSQALNASEPEVRITSAQLQQLRPAVVADLKDLLMRMNGGDPTPQELNEEFEACTFTAVQLGKLGPAVLVQDLNFAGKTNLALVNLYRLQNGKYQQLAAGQGWVEFLNGPEDIPDILYGWSSGVCHVIYYRLRYTAGKYSEDACNQTVDSGTDEDTCAIKACETSGAKVPTFPDPWQNGEMRNSRVRYILGPALTAEQIDNSRRVKSRP